MFKCMCAFFYTGSVVFFGRYWGEEINPTPEAGNAREAYNFKACHTFIRFFISVFLTATSEYPFFFYNCLYFVVQYPFFFSEQQSRRFFFFCDVTHARYARVSVALTNR